MFKNVSLRKRNINNRQSWILLGPDGQPISAFSVFIHELRKNQKNTVDSYARHVAEFIDYLLEVSAIHDGQLSKLKLTEAMEAYIDYLQCGVDSCSDIARKVAAQIQPGLNSATSLVPKVAAIRRFLRLSEDIRKEMAEMARHKGEGKVTVDGDPLFPGFGQRRELQSLEIRAMQANSMLAGVIAGGPKFIDCVVLKGSVKNIPYDQSRAFPLDKAMELIDSMPTYRDKAFYALLAASGCRTHEALQLLMEDIDVKEATVQLVNPKLRERHSSYLILTAEQRSSLAWKGRETQLTLLIEPFWSKFFEALKEYLDHERIAHGRHDFLFQYISGEQKGMPYFLSAASSRLEIFNKICNQINVILPDGTGGHSLRHMYGKYLLNYFPRASGDFGMPAPMVQQIMGHAKLKSTMKYAQYDGDLLKLEIENANRIVYGNGAPKNLNELKLAALEFQVAKIRNQLTRESVSCD